MQMRFMIWVLLLLPAIAEAQQGNVNVNVFRASATRGRAAICWEIEPTVLHYQRVNTTDSTIAASYETELRIYKDTTLVKTDRWITKTPSVLPQQAAALNLLDGYVQTVPPGTYRVEIQCTESVAPETSFTLQKTFEVDTAVFQTMAPPQLLDTFYQSTTAQGVFAQNGMLALPLATDFLGDERPLLHFYTEAYERPELRNAKKPLRMETAILKGGVPFGKLTRTDTCTFRNGVARLFSTMPLAKLPSGNFVLETKLTDANGKMWATSRRIFQRSNARPAPDTVTVADMDSINKGQKLDAYVDISKTFVQPYKLQQLRAILRMIQPIATPEEGLSIKVLSARGVDVEYLRTFIYTFFLNRNPKDADGEWQAYSDKVRTVNRLFNLGGRAGYETERGRVYLQYGPPTERTVISQESGSRPYEVWRYDGVAGSEKGGSFLFFQPGSQLDDYLLLHSTLPGEVRNRVWRSGLYTNGTNERSRAEMFFPER